MVNVMTIGVFLLISCSLGNSGALSSVFFCGILLHSKYMRGDICGRFIPAYTSEFSPGVFKASELPSLSLISADIPFLFASWNSFFSIELFEPFSLQAIRTWTYDMYVPLTTNVSLLPSPTECIVVFKSEGVFTPLMLNLPEQNNESSAWTYCNVICSRYQVQKLKKNQHISSIFF